MTLQGTHTGRLPIFATKLLTIDQQMEQLVDRIMDASSPSIVERYEQRLEKLEQEKLLLQEKLASQPKKRGTFEELFELSLTLLSNPQKIWRSPRLEHKRTVLKLAFEERLAYCRKNGLRIPKTTIPFSVLDASDDRNVIMVIPAGFEPATY